MIKLILKKIFTAFGFDLKMIDQRFNKYLIQLAVSENNLGDLVERLRKIVTDISNQELSQEEFNDYWELKRRALHAFQCSLMLKALEQFFDSKLTVVDIGDSAGTHMLYLKELTRGRFDIDSISINLDPKEVERIKASGQKAILCRAEDLNIKDIDVDLFTSFEMIEHLHNPAIFFRRLTKKSKCDRIVITVPYIKNSRLGLHNVRNSSDRIITAEEEHIFELSPEDWTLLMLHSGWKVIYSKIYYQYPRRWPIINKIFSAHWRKNDFEGFWGAILKKDVTFSDRYKDWEDAEILK